MLGLDLRCPVCKGELAEERERLLCGSCGESYCVEDGIPRLVSGALPGAAERQSELEGWVALARREGWYRADDEVDAVLPYVCRDLGWTDSVWRGNEISFTRLLRDFVEPGMRVLEVGAGKCWAAQHLVPLGCEYTGTDLLTDKLIGLGRGAFYAGRVGQFARVQADGEYLPFADASFDLTFCVASLHHARELDRMLSEMTRVTRPGGVVAALSEATKPLTRMRALAPDQEVARSLGINEHAHSLLRYFRAFRRAGLSLVRFETPDAFEAVVEAHPWMGGVLRLPGAMPAATLAAQGLLWYGGISVYARRRAGSP